MSNFRVQKGYASAQLAGTLASTIIATYTEPRLPIPDPRKRPAFPYLDPVNQVFDYTKCACIVNGTVVPRPLAGASGFAGDSFNLPVLQYIFGFMQTGLLYFVTSLGEMAQKTNSL